MQKKIKFFPAVLLLLCVFAVLLLAAYWVERGRSSEPHEGNEHGKTVEEMLGLEEEEALVYYNGKTYRKNTDVESYLLLGIDQLGEAQTSGSYNDGGQSDLILLLVIDHVQEQVTILQINRDTMTSVDVLGVRGDIVGSRTEQIAVAHAYGTGLEDSCENAVRAVSGLLYGVEIQGYASIRMEAMPVLNDMLGGVTVTIEDDFSQVDPTLVSGERVTLMGDQVLHFIRNRLDVGDGSNLSRMRRHRSYLSAFGEKLREKAETDPELFLKLYDAALPYVVTNVGSGTACTIAQESSKYKNNGVVTFDGEAIMGQTYVEYYADESSLKETVLSLFYIEET